MPPDRTETISKSYKGLHYSLTIGYVQERDNGTLVNEYATSTKVIIDGQPIRLGTPGFKDIPGRPEESVIAYIDYLVAQNRK